MQIDNLTIDYFEKLGFSDVCICKLNIKEKIRYGVPINTLVRIYGFFFTFFSLKTRIIRKVELKDRNQNEQTKFIELTIKKRKLIFCKEFDSYSF